MYQSEHKEGLAEALIRAGIKKSIVCKATTLSSYQYERIARYTLVSRAA